MKILKFEKILCKHCGNNYIVPLEVLKTEFVHNLKEYPCPKCKTNNKIRIKEEDNDDLYD